MSVWNPGEAVVLVLDQHLKVLEVCWDLADLRLHQFFIWFSNSNQRLMSPHVELEFYCSYVRMV